MTKRRSLGNINDGGDDREDREVGYFSSSFTSIDWRTIAFCVGIAAVAFVAIKVIINTWALTKQATGNVARNYPQGDYPITKTAPDPNAFKSDPVNATDPAIVAPKHDPVLDAPKKDPVIVAPKHDPVLDAPKKDPDAGRGYDPNFLNTAAQQAWFGQDRELAATCDRTLRFLKDTKTPALAERAAKICSLRPLDDKIHEAALVLARRAVELGKGQVALHPYLQMALGMAEYRSGNYAAADAALLAASQLGRDKYHVSCTTAFYQALSLFRQGKEVEAQRLAAEALARMRPLPADEKNPLAGGANADDLILWVAYKEAKELLKLKR